jgi:hypothetical protein
MKSNSFRALASELYILAFEGGEIDKRSAYTYITEEKELARECIKACLKEGMFSLEIPDLEGTDLAVVEAIEKLLKHYLKQEEFLTEKGIA